MARFKFENKVKSPEMLRQVEEQVIRGGARLEQGVEWDGSRGLTLYAVRGTSQSTGKARVEMELYDSAEGCTLMSISCGTDGADVGDCLGKIMGHADDTILKRKKKYLMFSHVREPLAPDMTFEDITGMCADKKVTHETVFSMLSEDRLPADDGLLLILEKPRGDQGGMLREITGTIGECSPAGAAKIDGRWQRLPEKYTLENAHCWRDMMLMEYDPGTRDEGWLTRVPRP